MGKRAKRGQEGRASRQAAEEPVGTKLDDRAGRAEDLPEESAPAAAELTHEGSDPVSEAATPDSVVSEDRDALVAAEAAEGGNGDGLHPADRLDAMASDDEADESIDEDPADPDIADVESESANLNLTDLSPSDSDPAEPEAGDQESDGEEAAGEAEGAVIAGEGIDPEITTERIVEAVLFSSDAPLPIAKIVGILGVGSARDVRNHIKTLNQRYEETGASFRIEQIASGYQMLTLPVYNTWVRRLKQTRQDTRLSPAALETLAVVAYKQPVVRAEIEAIRGVSAGEMLNRLRELGLIKIVGRAEDVGRPMLYGTTKRFLEVFGLSGLEDLPEVEELQPRE